MKYLKSKHRNNLPHACEWMCVYLTYIRISAKQGMDTHVRVFDQWALVLVPDSVGHHHDILDVDPEFLDLGSQEDSRGRRVLRVNRAECDAPNQTCFSIERQAVVYGVAVRIHASHRLREDLPWHRRESKEQERACLTRTNTGQKHSSHDVKSTPGKSQPR